MWRKPCHYHEKDIHMRDKLNALLGTKLGAKQNAIIGIILVLLTTYLVFFKARSAFVDLVVSTLLVVALLWVILAAAYWKFADVPADGVTTMEIILTALPLVGFIFKILVGLGITALPFGIRIDQDTTKERCDEKTGRIISWFIYLIAALAFVKLLLTAWGMIVPTLTLLLTVEFIGVTAVFLLSRPWIWHPDSRMVGDILRAFAWQRSAIKHTRAGARYLRGATTTPPPPAYNA